MSNTLMMGLIAAQLVALAVIYLIRARLTRNVFIVLAAVFVVAGIGMVLVTQLVYSTANTLALDTPLSLSRARAILDRKITTVLPGRYELFLETDHTAGIAKFGCLTGDDRFEALCPRADPELDAAWTVSDHGVIAAHGGSDVEGWRRRQAALDPAEAARRRAAYLNDMAKVENPSDTTPLFHSLGAFAAQGGHGYSLTLALRHPAPTLAAFHPRLLVGFSDTQTRGLGLWVILFCLIGVVGGGAMIIAARQGMAS